MKLRKWLSLLLLCVLCLSAAIPSALAQTQPKIQIYLDGNVIHSDVDPYIIPKANVTMVPIRVISQGLGAWVEWTASTRSVAIRKDDKLITMTVGAKGATVNNTNVELDTTVEVKKGRTMVPLRFVSQELGLLVHWDSKTQSVFLQTIQPPKPQEPTEPTEPTEPSTPPDQGGGDHSTLRGAWVSTVYNLDWPTTGSYKNIDKQQQEYIKLLDDLQGMGLNTVFVQVRPAGDALYPSSLIPWSKVLTGVQGQDPGYDPLAFMIDETHKRGMQFHAWFNPFRANTDTNTTNLDPKHVARQHPEWIVKYNNLLYINPGIPEARQHIIDAITEVAANYNVDGIHLDDYFYPSGGTFNDDLAFLAFNNGQFISKDDWRRDNINLFVQQLGQSIHNAKPNLQYGISPFGVWRNIAKDSTGSDTKAGVTTYDNMYADVRTWIQQGWIDYVIPQIYWSLSFSAARYDKLVDWWSNEVSGTKVKLYIGHAPYKLGTKETGWQTADEIVNQLKYNEQRPEVEGDVYFSAKDLRRNPLGLLEALRAYYGL